MVFLVIPRELSGNLPGRRLALFFIGLSVAPPWRFFGVVVAGRFGSCHSSPRDTWKTGLGLAGDADLWLVLDRRRAFYFFMPLGGMTNPRCNGVTTRPSR